MTFVPKYADVHADPKGAGDARPTAMDIIRDEGLEGKLAGKMFLVTGCSSGLGVPTAAALHATGAHVYITARDLPKGQAVAKEIMAANSGSAGKVEVLKLELDSLQSIRDFAAGFPSKQLNVLVLNAGVMACPPGTTQDGFETQFGTNHLGHFLLFQLLQPLLLASSTPDFNSRVVCLSSSGHRRSPVHLDDLDLKKQGYDPWVSYGQSKTANILMANEIERRYGSQGLHATSVHPGGIFTELGRHLDPAFFQSMMTPQVTAKLKSSEQGAATTVWAAVGKEWKSKGGAFLEDVTVAGPHDDGNQTPLAPGYAPHAYDEEAAKKLWEVSCQMVGCQE